MTTKRPPKGKMLALRLVWFAVMYAALRSERHSTLFSVLLLYMFDIGAGCMVGMGGAVAGPRIIRVNAMIVI